VNGRLIFCADWDKRLMPTFAVDCTTDVIHLDWTREDGTIVVTPENQDRYIIRVGKAIELLQLASKRDLFEKQLNLLLKTIAEWISNRNDLSAGYVTLRDGELSFVAVTKEVAYNPDFEDSLSDLAVAVSGDKDLDLLRLSTLALPPVEKAALSQFLDSSFTLKYESGEGSRPYRVGK
jgi:hypothetical protein